MSDDVLELLPDAFITDAGWARVNCPFCGDATGKDDRRQSLSVATDSGFYRCWKCETQGFVDPDAIPLRPRRRTSYSTETKRIVAPPNFVGLDDPSAYWARRYVLEVPIYDANGNGLWPTQIDKPRGLDPDVCEAAGVGTCSRGGYANRVIVPVTKPDGELGGWVARMWCKPAATGWDSLRYFVPSVMKRGNLLYNERAVYDEAATTPLIVVEGVFDALRHWPDAVAVFGKPTDTHLSILRRTTRPIAVVLDPDARMKGWALATKLQLYRKDAVQVHLPSKTDAAETDPQTLNRLVTQAFQRKSQ